MDHTHARSEFDHGSSFSDLHGEFQSLSHQDSSSDLQGEFQGLSYQDSFSLEYDASSPSLHVNHRSDRDHDSTIQNRKLESQAHPSSEYSLTYPKNVNPPVGSLSQTHQNFLPGQLGEQVIRYRHNNEYAPSLESEVHKKIAEAGFVISENKHFFSCQYCGRQQSFEIVNAGYDLWAMHYQHCYYLRLHHVDQQRQESPVANQGDTVSTTTGLTDHQSSQSRSSISREEQSRSFSEQSAGTALTNEGATDSNGKIHCIKRAQAPRYASYHQRFLTFASWPGSATQNPRQLAHVGFYYQGIEDFTRCFCCDVELKCWELDDDPLDQHNLWSPDCCYVMSLLRLERNTDNPTVNNPEAQSVRRIHEEQQFMNSHGRLSADGYSVLSREMQMKCPTDCDLGILSRSIGTGYAQLGLRLGLQYQRIKEIEEENRLVCNRCLAILIEWRDAQRGQATLGKLEKVFCTLNLNTMIFTKLVEINTENICGN